MVALCIRFILVRKSLAVNIHYGLSRGAFKQIVHCISDSILHTARLFAFRFRRGGHAPMLISNKKEIQQDFQASLPVIWAIILRGE